MKVLPADEREEGRRQAPGWPPLRFLETCQPLEE